MSSTSSTAFSARMHQSLSAISSYDYSKNNGLRPDEFLGDQSLNESNHGRQVVPNERKQRRRSSLEFRPNFFLGGSGSAMTPTGPKRKLINHWREGQGEEDQSQPTYIEHKPNQAPKRDYKWKQKQRMLPPKAASHDGTIKEWGGQRRAGRKKEQNEGKEEEDDEEEVDQPEEEEQRAEEEGEEGTQRKSEEVGEEEKEGEQSHLFSSPRGLDQEQEQSQEQEEINGVKAILKETKQARKQKKKADKIEEAKLAVPTPKPDLQPRLMGSTVGPRGTTPKATPKKAANKSTYDNIIYGSLTGTIILSHNHLVYNPDDPSKGPKKVAWSKIDKLQASPPKLSKQMLKVMLTGGKNLTFQVQTRDILMQLKDEISSIISGTQEKDGQQQQQQTEEVEPAKNNNKDKKKEEEQKSTTPVPVATSGSTSTTDLESTDSMQDDVSMHLPFELSPEPGHGVDPRKQYSTSRASSSNSNSNNSNNNKMQEIPEDSISIMDFSVLDMNTAVDNSMTSPNNRTIAKKPTTEPVKEEEQEEDDDDYGENDDEEGKQKTVNEEDKSPKKVAAPTLLANNTKEEIKKEEHTGEPDTVEPTHVEKKSDAIEQPASAMIPSRLAGMDCAEHEQIIQAQAEEIQQLKAQLGKANSNCAKLEDKLDTLRMVLYQDLKQEGMRNIWT